MLLLKKKSISFAPYLLHKLLKIFTKCLTSWPLADIVVEQGVKLGYKLNKSDILHR